MVAEDYKPECQYTLLDLIPVEKYRSTKTGISLCIAKVQGPLVNGYCCLATEAHDDDGLPHTLEHLVFLGSEKYPYKGILDLFANRCLAQGTNAWTDVDHTCYTLTTAGSEGFLNLLPIYLDHILYPTLTKSGYITEVHHINGDGEDAGVVYCEMQARENTGNSRTHLEFSREMYPGYCGYKSETGGITKNLRTTCSHEKVKNYHSSFYRPDNMCLIVTGQVSSEDVISTLKAFEEKIISKGKLQDFARPWQTPVPALEKTLEKTVLFPTEDESSGMVLIGWRGPHVLEYYKICALKILAKYLTDTSVAPLQKELVEIEDPLASDVHYSRMENLETCLYLMIEGVPKDKLFQVREKVEEVLKNHAERKVSFDMERMQTVLHRELLEQMNSLEDSPHDTMAGSMIGDFLYSDKPDRLSDYLNECARLKQLKKEPESSWVDVLSAFLVQGSKVVIIGDPSEKLMKEMAEEEKQRVKEQRNTLGETGLKEKQNALEKATEENEVEPPPDLVSTLKIPSVDSIHFFSIQTMSNRHTEKRGTTDSRLSVDDIPFAFQFDNIKSLFLQMNVILDTAIVPDELRLYLPLYSEIIFESPLLRNGELIPYEDVVKQLATDTLSNEASLGFSGDTFEPGTFSQVFMLGLKMETEKFAQGIQWLRELLYQIQFSVDRLKIVATKVINDIPNVKRSGRKVALALIRDINFTKGSNFYVTNMVRQQQFLSRLVKELDENPQKVLGDLEKLRTLLTNPSHLRFFLAADINKLPAHATSVIKENLLLPTVAKESQEQRPPLVKWDFEFLCDKAISKVVGVGSVESSFLYQTCPGIKDFKDPDYAPLLVLVEYLCTVEGPLWRQIRGLGLAYHYNISVNPSKGVISFILMKSTHIFSAYQKGKEIVDAFISGATEFDDSQIEAAVSGVMFEIISKEQSIGDAAFESMLSEFKGVDQEYNRELLKKVSQVTADDLKRVATTYFTRLFDSSDASCALCCHPSKVEEVVKSFKTFFWRKTKLQGHRISIGLQVDDYFRKKLVNRT